MTLSPKGMAAHGHSRAHLVHLEQKSCRPKSMWRSGVIGMSVVTTTDLNLGPTNGLSTSSPMRLNSPSPACSTSGMCSTSDSALVWLRALWPSERMWEEMIPAICAPRM